MMYKWFVFYNPVNGLYYHPDGHCVFSSYSDLNWNRCRMFNEDYLDLLGRFDLMNELYVVFLEGEFTFSYVSASRFLNADDDNIQLDWLSAVPLSDYVSTLL